MKALAIAALLLIPAVAEAQIVTEMTPELVREAIAKGGDVCHVMKKGARIIACFSTPYSRVAGAAADARKKYQPFTEADVTEEMVSPVLYVHGFGGWNGYTHSDVQAIAILPVGKKDPTAAIAPLSFEARRRPGGGTGVATFPLSVLSEDREVHVVYDADYCGSKDCAVRFKLDDVR